MLTLMRDDRITVQGGIPMTVRGEAAPPHSVGVGFAPQLSFFSWQISSGGGLGCAGADKTGGASAPLRGQCHA
jgi:hypothetical protein